VREWTKSACVAVALGIGLLLAVVGFTAVTGCGGCAHPAQAKASIASSSSSSSKASTTQSALAGAPASLLTEKAAQVVTEVPVTWIIRPGDTLSGIAAALGLRGGWQALYAANHRAIGADPDVIRPGAVLTVPGPGAPLRYTIASGDTLSAIAAALGVRGGWQALYAANRQVVGPDPSLIRPGAVLAVPGAAAGKAPTVPAASPGTGPGSHQASSSPPARGGRSHQPAAGGTPAAPAVPGSASPAGLVPVRGPGAAPGAGGIMPRWLKVTLLTVAVLTVASFVAQPAVTASRRRRTIRPPMAARRRARGRRSADRTARIVQADHERLIITYSMSDDTVYLLTPPGEDPRAVLRAARLVVPEDTYEDLADHLGVPSGWQRE